MLLFACEFVRFLKFKKKVLKCKITLLVQLVYARVTECRVLGSHLQTCSARSPGGCRCSARRPSTKSRSLRCSGVCRRRNVSTPHCSVVSSVGQSSTLLNITLFFSLFTLTPVSRKPVNVLEHTKKKLSCRR